MIVEVQVPICSSSSVLWPTGAGDWHCYPLGAQLSGEASCWLIACALQRAVFQFKATYILCVQVFIGIGMGVEPRISVIQPLLIALIFHQARNHRLAGRNPVCAQVASLFSGLSQATVYYLLPGAGV